jgi:hypothetical protein
VRFRVGGLSRALWGVVGSRERGSFREEMFRVGEVGRGVASLRLSG